MDTALEIADYQRMAINGPYRVPDSRYCKHCKEHIVRGSTHLNGGMVHWQDLAWSLPGLAGMAVMLMIVMGVLAVLMGATGVGSEYH